MSTCILPTKDGQGTRPQKTPPNIFPKNISITTKTTRNYDEYVLAYWPFVQKSQSKTQWNYVSKQYVGQAWSRMILKRGPTIQKRVSLAKPLYSSIVERTLKTRHTRTDINLEKSLTTAVLEACLAWPGRNAYMPICLAMGVEYVKLPTFHTYKIYPRIFHTSWHSLLKIQSKRSFTLFQFSYIKQSNFYCL